MNSTYCEKLLYIKKSTSVSQKYFSKIATSTFSSLISSTTFSFSDSVSEGSRMTENNRDPRFPTGVGGVN